MKKKLLFTLLMLLPFGSAFAQQGDTMRRNEIALDVAPIFRINPNLFVQPELSLLYRYHFNCGALRLKANATISNSSGSNTNANISDTSSSSSTTNSSNIDIRPGWQFEKPVGLKNLFFYYGLDAVLQLNPGKSTSTSDFANAINKSHQESTTTSSQWGIGGAPVLGLSLHLSRSFSIGVENSFALVYQKSKSSSTTRTITYDSNGTLKSDTKTVNSSGAHGLSFALDPIHNLSVYLGFRF